MTQNSDSQKVSKGSVNYRFGTETRHCGNCSMFNGLTVGSCDLVEGIIIWNEVCDKWEIR